MPQTDVREILTEALLRLKRVNQRMISYPHAVLNATRNADRISLSNDAHSIRLDLSLVDEFLRAAIESLEEETYVPFDAVPKATPEDMAGMYVEEVPGKFRWEPLPDSDS